MPTESCHKKKKIRILVVLPPVNISGYLWLYWLPWDSSSHRNLKTEFLERLHLGDKSEGHPAGLILTVQSLVNSRTLFSVWILASSPQQGVFLSLAIEHLFPILPALLSCSSILRFMPIYIFFLTCCLLLTYIIYLWKMKHCANALHKLSHVALPQLQELHTVIFNM